MSDIFNQHNQGEIEMGKGQGNGGGWPSTTGDKSGGGRSNGPAGGGKGK